MHLYADDAVLVCHTAAQLQTAVLAPYIAFTQWGLAISVPNTKVMVMRPTVADSTCTLVTRCQEQALGVVDQFRYLGGMVC